MKRKILSLILVAALLASMLVFAPSAGAADAEASVEVTDAAAKAGDTVSVDVIITTTSTLLEFQLLMEYDESKLTLVKDGDNNAVFHDTWSNYGGNPVIAFGDLATDGNFYGIFSSEAKVNALDATEGIKVATFTFTVNEGATGSAYVGFKYVNKECFVTTALGQSPLNTDGAVDYIPGAITILPDDYKTPIEFTVLDDFDELFDIMDNGDGTCEISSYFGVITEGAVEIPEQIAGLTVTSIGANAFSGCAYTAIKIPATVTSIGANAFLNANSLKDIFVLGSNVTVAATSFRTNAGGTVLHSVAGGTVESHVGTFGSRLFLTFEELAPANTLTYTVDGVTATYEVAASTVAPGGMVVGDKTVIAWTDGTNTYAPGASIAVDGALALEAITVTIPKTANGASIKKAAAAEDLAIRFTADIAQADYTALVEAFGAANVKLGMLVTPQKYVNNAGAFTKEALTAYAGENAYVDIAVKGYYEKNDVAGTYTLAGSLTGFSAKTIAKNPDFVAVAYISVDVDGDGDVDATVYGQYDYHTARNVLDVATLANNASTDATEKGLLATIIGWFTNGSKN